MRYLLQIVALICAVITLGASTASAQVYDQIATASDLDDGNGNTNLECLARTSTGLLVGYNFDAETLYTYDASTQTLAVLRSSADIQSDIGSATPPIDACDAVTSDDSDNLYFSLRDDENDSYLYRINASGSASSVVVQNINGANALEATSDGLYLGIVGNFSSLDNGLYRVPLPLTGSDSPTAILNDASIADISMDKSLSEASTGDLYLVTGDFFTGSEFNKVYRISDPNGSSPAITEFADPIANGPLSDGELYHLEVVNFAGEDRIVVSNNSFSATNGEELAVIRMDGSADLLTTASDIQANTSLSDFTPSQDGGFVVTTNGELIVVSRDGGSFGESGLVSITQTALPVELAAFDVRALSDQRVEVTWTTASETNNAGFAVESRRADDASAAWTELGQREGQVNSAEPTTYRFVTAALPPGTHAFRLKQTDLDGTTTYTEPQTARVAPAQPITLQGPNPLRAGQSTTLLVSVDAPQTIEVGLYNVLGQRVRSVFRGPAAPSTPVETGLQTSGLPSGLYFVRVTGATVTGTQRLTIVR